MKKAIAMAAVLAVMAGAAGAANKTIGYGLGMNRADARLLIDDNTAVDGYLGFNNMGNDSYSQNTITIGGYYMGKIAKTKPADLHWLGGVEIGIDSGDALSATQIALFAGIGSEYFLPGTENLSLEVNAGVKFTTASGDIEGHSFGLDSLNGVTFRYYFK